MIYLIEDRDYLKIGYTRNLKNRLEAYELHNCYAKLLATKEGTLEDEKNLHALCKKYCYKGEWFHNCKEVKEIFHNYKWDGEEWILRWKNYIEERAYLIKTHWCGFGVTNQGRKLINYLDNNNKEFRTCKAAHKLKNFTGVNCNYIYYIIQNEALSCAVAINKPEIGDTYRLLSDIIVTYGEEQ